MRELLLAAAEEVLLTKGYEGFTVRAVTSVAAVNVAAVTTSFGSRAALVDALLVRLMEPVNLERDRRYGRLEDRASVSALLRAFFEPLSMIGAADGSAMSALLRLLVADRAPEGRLIERLLHDPGVAVLEAALARAPDGPAAADRGPRLRLAIGTVVAIILSGEGQRFPDGRLFEEIMVFVTAGISAPALDAGSVGENRG